MSKIQQYDYFYGDETLQFSFYRIPKQLITQSEFKTLSNDAKILYGLLLDKTTLSQKNKWLDDNMRVYVIYTIESIMEDLNIARAKACKILRELEGIGLVEKKRRGQGNPSWLFVKSCFKPLVYTETNMKNQELFSQSALSDPYGFCFGLTDKQMVGTIKLIQQNVEYSPDRFSNQEEQELFEELYSIICDVVLSSKPVMHINQNDYPAVVVKSVFLKLTFEHVQYVMESMKDNLHSVRNIRNYLISSLYNSYFTLAHHSQNEYNTN